MSGPGPILQGFGQAMGIAGQIQDAVNKSVRQGQNTGGTSIRDGELHELDTTQGNTLRNPLGREVDGAFIVAYPDHSVADATVVVSGNDVELEHDGTLGTFRLWVF